MASKHLPPELIAHIVSFLQTADTHDVCFGGRTNHLDRLRRRADSLCRDRAALAVVCREWRGILSQKAFKAATWTRALFGVEQTHGAERDFALRRRAVHAEGARYLRTTYDIPRGRRDPAQPKICSFFPHKNGRARCWGCGAKHAVAA